MDMCKFRRDFFSLSVLVQCLLIIGVWVCVCVSAVWQRGALLQMAEGWEKCVAALIWPAVLVSSNQGLPVARRARVHLPESEHCNSLSHSPPLPFFSA